MLRGFASSWDLTMAFVKFLIHSSFRLGKNVFYMASNFFGDFCVILIIFNLTTFFFNFNLEKFEKGGSAPVVLN